VQVAPLLLLGAVVNDHRTAHAQPDDVDRVWRPRLDHLLAEDQLLHERRATTAVFARPVQPQVARLVELPLPADALFQPAPSSAVVGPVAVGPGGPVAGEPGADLVAKGLLSRSEVEVHSRTLVPLQEDGARAPR